MIAQATLMILPENSLCLWHERCNYTVKGLMAVRLITLATDNLRDPGRE